MVDEVRLQLALPESNGRLIKSVTAGLSAYRNASDLISKRIGDDALGLHAALHFPRGSYGLLEFTAYHAPTVGEALTRIANYMPLVTDTCRIQVSRSGNEFILEHGVPGESSGLGRHANEFALATFLRIVRECARAFICPLRVQFAHTAPNDISELVQFFGTRNIVFGQSCNRLAFADQVSSIPVASRDEQLFPWLDEYASTLIAPASRSDEPIAGMRRHIRSCLQERAVVNLAQIARSMRISARTLQRRLQDARTSFRDELDEVRRELAKSYLRDPNWSIKEIASRLGFADRKSFERAFLKWCHTTPNVFRKSLPPPEQDSPRVHALY